MNALFGQKVISSADMRAAENAAFSKGTTEDELISRAARGLIRDLPAGPVAVAAGSGNNGCDGLEAALLLRRAGRDVTVVAAGEKRCAGGERRLAELRQSGARFARSIEKGKFAVVLDCVFGTGLSREPSGEYARVIEEINASGAFVVSADVPSGLSADSGREFSPCVTASRTVSFGGIKSGLLLGTGRNRAGEIVAFDIGVDVPATGFVSSPENAVLPARQPASHKGCYGRVKVVGGSAAMPGAPLMSFEAAEAAIRGGAGLVTLCVPDEAKAAYMSRVKQEMLCFLPSSGGHIAFDPSALDTAIAGATAATVGCGMGRYEDAKKIVRHVSAEFSGPLVLDADALFAVAADRTILNGHRAKLILTPHVGEFSRLIGKDEFTVSDIKSLARDLGAVIAMKSATTVITDGDRVFFNVTGTPAMAKGGSGDILAGLTAAFSCVLPPLEATVAACFIFGECGERAAKNQNTVTSLTADDIIVSLAHGV